jgi:hypothetical protein
MKPIVEDLLREIIDEVRGPFRMGSPEGMMCTLWTS